ncbi:hypothetical protein Godav_008932, partial [Gossypium davidsonii]|nr:hypothetical protein [Gossypium davidsonii]MBA0659023.1 hypothetical protein [Gossypium klotzschianum]
MNQYTLSGRRQCVFTSRIRKKTILPVFVAMGVNNGDHSIFKGEFEEDGSMERVILSLEP